MIDSYTLSQYVQNTLLIRMLHKDHVICFNVGERCAEKFIAQEGRPNFYWFHDEYYGHVSITKHDRYMHIFVTKKEKGNFTFMQGNNDWVDVIQYFVKNKESIRMKREEGRSPDSILSSNPPILRSSETLTPSLILDFNQDIGGDIATVIFPEKAKGKSFTMFDKNGFPIEFSKIPGFYNAIYGVDAV